MVGYFSKSLNKVEQHYESCRLFEPIQGLRKEAPYFKGTAGLSFIFFEAHTSRDVIKMEHTMCV